MMVNILCSTPFNPLSSNINMYILLSVLHTFLEVQVEGICVNIKIFYVW